MAHLHEETGAERSADVEVIISAGELCAAARQVEAVHDPGQLLPHVVSRHQRTVVDKVVVAPLIRLVVFTRAEKGEETVHPVCFFTQFLPFRFQNSGQSGLVSVTTLDQSHRRYFLVLSCHTAQT